MHQTSLVFQKRESFRQEIRKQDVEQFFYQKRLQYRQKEDHIPLLQIEPEKLIPTLRLAYQNNDAIKVQQLHVFAFRLTCDDNEIIRKNNIIFLIKQKYIEECIYTLLHYERACGDVFRTLANTAFAEQFQQQNQDAIKKCLEIAFISISQSTNSQDIRDILIFIGNVASQSEIICQEFVRQNFFNRLLELTSSNDLNFLRNICYCLHVICERLDKLKLLQIDDRITALKIIMNCIRKKDSDMIHCEILHPLTVVYCPCPQIDELFLEAPDVTKFIFGTFDGEYIEVTLQVIKQLSLSETIEISERLLEEKVLDKIIPYIKHNRSKLRKLALLILNNLSYNNASISEQIIYHATLPKLINVIITEPDEWKIRGMKVILNLQATGNDVVFDQLLYMGLLTIILNQITTQETELLVQFLNCILRFLIYDRDTESPKFKNEVPKILEQAQFRQRCENIERDFNNPLLQEVLTKINSFYLTQQL